ncbi:MAG: hypothetical protein EOO27_01025 [Comamonadaceae bacterium]|nr:MAG: hypothetical protein EOO27_01025 [Comamonadaceae bacterium]
MGRDRNKKPTGRDPGGFVALPWSVLDCPAWAALSHPARSLLLELARQFVRDNNGRLLASGAYLAKRGWTSNDVVTRALRELMAAGFVHQMVRGRRPNRASWYAVTWYVLDRHPDYDAGAAESFERGAYRKNAVLTPSHGAKGAPIAPYHGVEASPVAPSGGAIRAPLRGPSTPSHGDHLEKPSACMT